MGIRKWHTLIGLVLLLAGDIAPSPIRGDEVKPFGSQTEEVRVLPVERDVVTKIVDAVRKHAPDVKVTFPHESQVRMEFLCQEYSVYHGGKGGPDDELTKEKGPTDRGFMVTLEWWKEAYNGQAGSYGGELREFYWSRHLNEFKLPMGRGFVRMDYSPGALTDPKIRAAILTVLQKEGGLEKKRGADSDPRTNRYPIDELFDELEPRLRMLIQKKHPEATVKRVGQELLVTYRVREFVLHAVDADGSVAKDSHVEVGPAEDGFLIKIGGARATVRGQTLPIHGMASGPFWNRVWNSFSAERSGDREFIRYGVIRFETSYLSKSHHPLFREIEKLLSEYGKPAINGLYQ